MKKDDNQLNILVPRSLKPKLDYLHREVEHAAGRPLSRRQALGLGGMALLAGAVGCSTSTSPNSANSPSSPASSGAPSSAANPLTGKPVEGHLEIYTWSEYSDPSTFTKFTKLPAEANAGLTLHQTFYSSNDELLAKLHAGGT